jgi:hypothetical protein
MQPRQQRIKGIKSRKMPLGNPAQFPPDGLSTAPAAAAPRSPYRHLELCGIAFTIKKIYTIMKQQ